MSDRKFLPLSLKTATLTFKKLNLGNESILKGCRRIPAGLFEEYHFAFRGLKLMVPVPKIEVGGLDFPEGDKSFFPEPFPICTTVGIFFPVGKDCPDKKA